MSLHDIPRGEQLNRFNHAYTVVVRGIPQGHFSTHAGATTSARILASIHPRTFDWHIEHYGERIPLASEIADDEAAGR